MEEEKLAALHATLKQLAPKGKVGGLGFYAARNGSCRMRTAADSMPEEKRMLYSRFVREGEGPGRRKRFTIDDDEEVVVKANKIDQAFEESAKKKAAAIDQAFFQRKVSPSTNETNHLPPAKKKRKSSSSPSSLPIVSKKKRKRRRVRRGNLIILLSKVKTLGFQVPALLLRAVAT